MNYSFDWKKYLIALLITAFIFITSIYISNYFSNQKLESLRFMGDSISIDILSSDTQFELLESASCEAVDKSNFTQELNALGERLSYAEDQNIDKEEIKLLKKQYTLLLIKDYLLMQRIQDKCSTEPIFVLYFYSNNENECRDCEKQGHVLTFLRKKYPQLRIYSFDYNLDIPALETLIAIENIDSADSLPVIILKDDKLKGFQSLDSLESLPLFKELEKQRIEEEEEAENSEEDTGSLEENTENSLENTQS